MLKALGGGVSTFGYTYQDVQWKEQTGYILDKRHCMILATWYSIELRAKIIDRWEELERWAIVKPKSTIEMLREAVMELEAKEKEIARLGTTITKQNETNVKLFELTAGATKTGLKVIKDDLGAEINTIVFKVFGDLYPGDHRAIHLHARKDYEKETGKIYWWAKATSLEGKKEYLSWLQKHAKITP